MGSTFGVLLAALRRRTRSTGARFFVGAVVLALAVAILLPSGGAGGAAVVLESVLVVIGIGAALAAASSAGSLPEDRASGVHAWLAASACPRAALRAAPAVAGVVVTVVVAIGTTLVAAAAMATWGTGVTTRHTTPLTHARIGSGATGIRGLAVDPVDSTRTDVAVELDVRPRFRTLEATGTPTFDLIVRDDRGRERTVTSVPVRGRVDVSLPPTSRTSIEAVGAGVELSIVSARRIDGPASSFANVLRAGLLIGLAFASIAPIAVLLSRFLSTASAVAASLVLAGVGVLRGPLLSLAADAQGVAGASIASAILRGATSIAPDLSPVGGASDALVGHVITAGAFASLWAPALHAFVALLLLAFVPARRGRA